MIETYVTHYLDCILFLSKVRARLGLFWRFAWLGGYSRDGEARSACGVMSGRQAGAALVVDVVVWRQHSCWGEVAGRGRFRVSRVCVVGVVSVAAAAAAAVATRQ